MSKLLREFITLEYDKNLVKEAVESKKPIVLENVLLQHANKKNANRKSLSQKGA